ncbi:MAG: LysE family translocator [Burkholderiaceae bacterium]
MISAEFLLTSLIVVLIPGTGVIYTLSTGLFSGRRASLFAALGCTLGIVPHMAAGIFGLAAILHMSALAFQVIKFVGVGYLLYLAWSMWRASGALTFDRQTRVADMRRITLRGLLINILNPKLTLFFFAFLPQFVRGDATSAAAAMLVLGAVFMAMTFVVFVLYGAFAAWVSQRALGSSAALLWSQRSFAVVFAALGLKLAMAER